MTNQTFEFGNDFYALGEIAWLREIVETFSCLRTRKAYRAIKTFWLINIPPEYTPLYFFLRIKEGGYFLLGSAAGLDIVKKIFPLGRPAGQRVIKIATRR